MNHLHRTHADKVVDYIIAFREVGNVLDELREADLNWTPLASMRSAIDTALSDALTNAIAQLYTLKHVADQQREQGGKDGT